jgi:hypothetical protein
MKKEILKLLQLPEMEKAVCATLITQGYCSGELKYGALKVTVKGADKIRFTRLISDEFVTEFRNLFPPGRKASFEEVMSKLSDLFSENDYTEEMVISATTMYLGSLNNLMYCEKAGNFISKREGGTIRSTLKEYIELLSDEVVSPNNAYKGDNLK